MYVSHNIFRKKNNYINKKKNFFKSLYISFQIYNVIMNFSNFSKSYKFYKVLKITRK